MKKKLMNFTDEEINIIAKIKEEQNIKTDIDAVRYALELYQKVNGNMETLAQEIVKVFLDSNYKRMDRMYWAVTTAEKNTSILLDIMNTKLIKENMTECIPVDVIEAKPITVSKEVLADKINHFKQKKDGRNSRQKR